MIRSPSPPPSPRHGAPTGGTIIGNATIDWVDRPHFYQQGGLIVLYAGEDEAILSALEGALGEPFVIGESSFAPEPADE